MCFFRCRQCYRRGGGTSFLTHSHALQHNHKYIGRISRHFVVEVCVLWFAEVCNCRNWNARQTPQRCCISAAFCSEAPRRSPVFKESCGLVLCSAPGLEPPTWSRFHPHPRSHWDTPPPPPHGCAPNLPEIKHTAGRLELVRVSPGRGRLRCWRSNHTRSGSLKKYLNTSVASKLCFRAFSA